MRRKDVGLVLICMGLLFQVAAGFLVLRNVREASNAGKCSQEVVQQLDIPVRATIPPKEVLPREEKTEEAEVPEVPDYQYNPKMEMPEQEIDGHRYIATMEIPELELTLPIMSKLTMPKLKIAPCRYSGTVYQKNLIIGAHNYDSHFGRLKKLSYGSQILVTDMDGNAFTYEVADIEILQPNQVEDLKGGDWPLTLFTCTIGGKTRVVVRCDILETA